MDVLYSHMPSLGIGADLLDLRHQIGHQCAAGKQQMVCRVRVNIMSHSRKAALEPAQKLFPLLPGKLHLRHIAVQCRDQLFHLAVAFIFHLIVNKDQRAVFREI